MTHVFLSYSSQDRYFAELALIKMKEAKIKLWQDRDQLRAGDDWRSSIEQGIATSQAIIVVLSENAVASPYVTYEWAYGLGNRKAIVPVKLDNCDVHPRLEFIQHLDFSVKGELPWSSLVKRIREIDVGNTGYSDEIESTKVDDEKTDTRDRANKILNYINERGYQMISYDRVNKLLDSNLSDQELEKFVKETKNIFRTATLKGDKPGLAKLIP